MEFLYQEGVVCERCPATRSVARLGLGSRALSAEQASHRTDSASSFAFSEPRNTTPCPRFANHTAESTGRRTSRYRTVQHSSAAAVEPPAAAAAGSTARKNGGKESREQKERQREQVASTTYRSTMLARVIQRSAALPSAITGKVR